MRRSSFILNDKEQKVLDAFPKYKDDGETKPITIEDLAAECWKNMGVGAKTKGNSWVRNSLRKLLRLGLIKNKGNKSGEYTRSKLSPAEVLEKAEKRGDVKALEEKKPKAAKKAAAPKGEKKAKAPKKAAAPKAEKKPRPPRRKKAEGEAKTAEEKKEAKEAAAEEKREESAA